MKSDLKKSIETINLDFLNSHGLGTEFIKRMLEIYREDISFRQKELSEFPGDSASTKSIKRHLHTLGSHTRDLGYLSVHEKLLKVEQNVDTSGPIQLKINIEEIFGFLEVIAEDIDHQLAQLNGNGFD